MDFSSCDIDLSSHNDGDVMHAVCEVSKTFSFLFPPALKKLPKTDKYDVVRLLINTVPKATTAYTYLVTKNKRISKLMSHEVVSHTLVNAGEVRPITSLALPIKVNEPNVTIEDVVVAVDGLRPEEILNNFPKAELNKKVNLVGCPGVALKIDTDVYCGPLVNGDPVFDSVGQAFLKDHDVEVEVIRSKEIVTAHVIVDMITLKKGQAAPKLPPKEVGCITKDDAEQMSRLLVEVVRYFGKRLSTEGSQKGRALMKTILSIMVQSREQQGYNDFLNKVVTWANTQRFVRVAKKFGEYSQDSLEYARILLERTRGIRGGDDSDSTSIGLATYLDINTDRSVVRVLSRVADVNAVLKIVAGVKQVSFVGKNARSYVEALLLVDSKIDKIGISNPQFPSWACVNGVWSNDDFHAKLTSEIGGLVFNVDLLDLGTDNSAKHQTFGAVQLVKCPLDYYNGRFVPSSLIHDLNGFLLPDGFLLPKKTLERLKKTYLTVVNKINITRTYPSLFANDRAVNILRSYSYPVINFNFYNRFATMARAEGFVTLMTSQTGMDVSLLDFMTDAQVQTIAAAVQQKATAQETREDDDFTVLGEGDDADGGQEDNGDQDGEDDYDPGQEEI